MSWGLSCYVLGPVLLAICNALLYVNEGPGSTHRSRWYWLGCVALQVACAGVQAFVAADAATSVAQTVPLGAGAAELTPVRVEELAILGRLRVTLTLVLAASAVCAVTHVRASMYRSG